MGDMKILLLAVAIVGIIINTTESSSSFTFLAEFSKIHVETSVKGLRVSLKFTTAISLLNVKTNFNLLNTIVTSYKTLPYLQEGSTMKAKYIDALNPGINHLASISNLYTQLFSFTDADKNIEPKSSGRVNRIRKTAKIVVCLGLTSLTSRQSGGPLLPPTTTACSGGDPSLISQHRQATQHQHSVKPDRFPLSVRHDMQIGAKISLE